MQSVLTVVGTRETGGKDGCDYGRRIWNRTGSSLEEVVIS